ncbi:MAG: CAP domain-containing protein [Microthrixaceae bacterium]
MPSRRLVALLTATLVLAAGCSIREVQAWYAVRRFTITTTEARRVAEIVNANRAPGCDTNYEGCVPDNQAEVHCLGTAGAGPEISGPIRVTGWDHFGLDPDGNGIACEGASPVGSIDVLTDLPADSVDPETGVGPARIRIAGWAVDYDTDAPIEVHVYDNGVGHAVSADLDRADLAGRPRGTRHGYDSTWSAQPGVHRVCAYGINVDGGGNVELGCKTFTVAWDQYQILLVNRERAANGLGPVTQCRRLSLAAQAHSDDQAAHTTMSHTGSDGSSPADRVTAAGYVWTTIGENVAYGYDDEDEVMTAWMNSPGHRANILDADFTNLGLGRTLASNGRLYWTQEFGHGGPCTL